MRTGCVGNARADLAPRLVSAGISNRECAMAYIVRISRIGRAGVPAGAPRVYEASDEADALAIVAYEVDRSKLDRPRVATVTDARGRLLFTYSGRTDAVST